MSPFSYHIGSSCCSCCCGETLLVCYQRGTFWFFVFLFVLSSTKRTTPERKRKSLKNGETLVKWPTCKRSTSFSISHFYISFSSSFFFSFIALVIFHLPRSRYPSRFLLFASPRPPSPSRNTFVCPCQSQHSTQSSSPSPPPTSSATGQNTAGL